jgi:hypothetical protein
MYMDQEKEKRFLNYDRAGQSEKLGVREQGSFEEQVTASMTLLVESWRREIRTML